MDEEETELRNPFPSPPSHYTNYTAHNLALLALLKQRHPPPSEADGAEAGLATADQQTLLSDQPHVPDWPLASLEPPRVDWVLAEGHYAVFGDTWFVKETIPSLAELGGQQLYPADPSADRRPALLTILRSLLATYSRLLTALLAPPPSASARARPDWQGLVEWMTVLAQNIMAAANDLRPVQARGNLEMMMRRQVELRREEARAVHAKCDALEAKLAEMRASVQSMSAGPREGSGSQDARQPEPHAPTQMGVEDVLRWTEEIG